LQFSRNRNATISPVLIWFVEKRNRNRVANIGMSDQLAGKSRLDAALIGHHNIAVLSALPATGFFPAGASDVLFNRSTTVDAHGLPIPDSRFFQQQQCQIEGIAAMRMSMAPGLMASAMPGQSSFPSTTRIPHFPSIIPTPSS
jgi:hypothetical protein